MKTVRLGKTGLYVSKIGIGGIPIQRPTEDKAIKVIQRALDLGVTFIDTSRAYRTSEKRIGKAIVGRRDQVVIATKAGWQDKITALTHLEESLQQLNTDYIDLWQFHNVSTLEGFERLFKPDGAMEAAQEALKAGKIRHVGLSSHSPIVAKKAVISDQFETIMFPFNFVARELGVELVPLTLEHDVGFIAMKPLGGGMLQDANLSIKYLLQFENVVPIPGIEKIDEIEEIVNIATKSWELTVQERQEIEEIRNKLDTQICRRCGYCQPCSEKVVIIPLVNMASLWKLWPREALHPEASTRFSKSLVNFVESGRNCTQCGECEEKCPYHLPIREMIIGNIQFYENMVQGKY